MLDHVSITVSALAAAETFYDAVFAALEVAKVGSDHGDAWVGYGDRCDADNPDRTYVSIRTGPAPEDAQRRHWCFKARSSAAVDSFWRAGVESGGTDHGKPGLRTQYHPSYYASFLRDPDGNRIEAVCNRP